MTSEDALGGHVMPKGKNILMHIQCVRAFFGVPFRFSIIFFAVKRADGWVGFLWKCVCV